MSDIKRPRRFLRLNQLVSNPTADPPVDGILPCSAVTWWRWVRAGEAPEPYQLGANLQAWASDEIDAWLASRPRGFHDRAGQFRRRAVAADQQAAK